MAQVLPREVQIQVKLAAYRKADEFGYMYKSRVESGEFMDRLVRDREVGAVLADFMSKDSIKTYIKDAILNRYMKDKKKERLPSDPEGLGLVVARFYGSNAYPIDGDSNTHLFRLNDDSYALVSQGTLLKWETALRKALEYIEKAPGLPPQGVKMRVLLNIASLGTHSTHADRDHLKKSLAFVGVDVNFAD